jgi:hypothetical protein
MVAIFGVGTVSGQAGLADSRILRREKAKEGFVSVLIVQE